MKQMIRKFSRQLTCAELYANIWFMPVIGHTDHNWVDVCESLLGIRPLAENIKGQRLQISWLEDNFHQLLDDADDVQVQQFT